MSIKVLSDFWQSCFFFQNHIFFTSIQLNFILIQPTCSMQDVFLMYAHCIQPRTKTFTTIHIIIIMDLVNVTSGSCAEIKTQVVNLVRVSGIDFIRYSHNQKIGNPDNLNVFESQSTKWPKSDKITYVCGRGTLVNQLSTVGNRMVAWHLVEVV